MGQPGLKHALDSYAYSNNTFVIAEAACFECKTKGQWIDYFTTVFNNPYGKVKYMRYYNIDPFVSAPGSLEGLRGFVEGYNGGEGEGVRGMYNVLPTDSNFSCYF
jgi:hypothetical protein